MNKTKKILYTLIGFVFSVVLIPVILFYFFSLLNYDKNNYNIDKNWIDCIGTLIERNNCAECSSKFEYNCNNIYYEEYSMLSTNCPVLGSKFWLKINPKFPKKYIPLDWKPVFTIDESTNFTKGTVKKIFGKWVGENATGINTDSLSKNGITYCYKIENENYQEYQMLPPNYKSLFSKLQIGQEYEVEYLIDNPERAIIHLDKPIVNTVK